MRYAAVGIVVGACLAVARPAHAEERGVVVLHGASEGDPIVLKLSDELGLLGFDVEVAPPGTDRARTRDRANAGGAVAVVLIDERGIEVRVVTAERVHERQLKRRAADPSTSALEAVEVIRGYLVPVDKASTEPAPREPAALPGPAASKPRSWSARLSGGFLSVGSFPTLGSVTLGGAKHVGRFAVDVAAVGTVPRADGWGGGLGVGVYFAPLGYTRVLSFSVGVGATGVAVAYREDGKKYSTVGAAIPHVGVVVRARINDAFYARLDGMFGVSIPSPGFKSKTGSDVEFGTTIGAASLGLEVAW